MSQNLTKAKQVKEKERKGKVAGWYTEKTEETASNQLD